MTTKTTEITFNDDQKKLLNIIIDNGNKDNNFEILVDDIVNIGDNKNEKSVRSKLTTEKMKKYILYIKKTDNNKASVKLLNNDKSTYDEVIKILNKDKQQ